MLYYELDIILKLCGKNLFRYGKNEFLLWGTSCRFHCHCPYMINEVRLHLISGFSLFFFMNNGTSYALHFGEKKECQLSKIAAFYIVICVVLWISYHRRWAVGKTTSRVIVAVSSVLLCYFDTGWVKVKYLLIPNRLRLLTCYIFALPIHPYIPALHMKSNTKLCFCIS